MKWIKSAATGDMINTRHIERIYIAETHSTSNKLGEPTSIFSIVAEMNRADTGLVLYRTRCILEDEAWVNAKEVLSHIEGFLIDVGEFDPQVFLDLELHYPKPTFNAAP